MHKDLTIHASSVKELFYYAIEQGAAAEQLSAMSGLKETHFSDSDARIPVQKIVSLWHAAIELTGNPALALQLGASSTPENAGIISLVCMSSPTLGEMLSRVIRYTSLISESDRFELIETANNAQLVFNIEAPEAFTIYGIERSFAIGMNWVNEFLQTRMIPEAIHFQYRAPAYIAEYEKVFSAPLYFEQENNALIFKKQWLDLSAKNYNPYLDDLVQRQATLLLTELGAKKTLRDWTTQLIIKQLPEGNVNVDHISNIMNMSRRTLARKLKEEHTTFQNLLENTRRKLATDYLQQNSISINDIAFLLGFSESSTFSRAFKRWFGNYPQEHRAMQASHQ